MAAEESKGKSAEHVADSAGSVEYVDVGDGVRVSEPFVTPESEQDKALVAHIEDRVVRHALERDWEQITDGQDVDYVAINGFAKEEFDGEAGWYVRVDLYEDSTKWNGGWVLASVSELGKVERVAARIGHGCRIEIIPDEPGTDSASILVPVDPPALKA